MAHPASQLAALPNRRISSLIAPREHGAWGLLFVPLATGAALGLLAGGNGLPLLALAIASLSLFWLRTPVESWLGTGLLRAQGPRERRAVGITVLLLAAIASVALVALFSKGFNRELLMLGAIAVSAFLAQVVLRKLGRRTRMTSQIVGTLGLTFRRPPPTTWRPGRSIAQRGFCGWPIFSSLATRFISCSSAYSQRGPSV